MPMKVAIIGAGSLIFARRLMQDILAVGEFADTTFGLTDIDKRNLDMVTRLIQRDIEANGLPAKVVSTTTTMQPGCPRRWSRPTWPMSTTPCVLPWMAIIGGPGASGSGSPGLGAATKRHSLTRRDGSFHSGN